MKTLLTLLSLLAGLFMQPLAQAQTAAAWPTARPLRIVVAFGPGSASDIFARMVGEQLQKSLAQAVVVENKPGAAGQIAAELVARAPGDGYTLFLTTNTTHSANPYLFKSLRYDPIKDFTPVVRIAYFPFVLLVNESSPLRSVRELVAQAKAKPEGITYGSTGVGSLAHLVDAMLEQNTGARMLHIPYKGAGPGLTDLLGGNLQIAYYTAVAVYPHVKSGKLRALGVTTEKRVDAFPNALAIGEVVPGFAVARWKDVVKKTNIKIDVIG